jgi:uncharacterized protein
MHHFSMLLRAMVTASLILIAAVEAVVAGPFEDAETAYKVGDYATAYRLWHPLADQGDAVAQLKLGVMHLNGWGVPQDYSEALKWYGKAAEQGNAFAQFYLGIMHASGRGVPQDYAESAEWYRKAAEQGNALAQNNLGVAYHKGQGVQQDYGGAVKWYRKAAEHWRRTTLASCTKEAEA